MVIKMKKLIALLLALVMVLGLVACGTKEAPKTEEKKEDTSAPTEEKKEETSAGSDNLAESEKLLAEAIANVKTTDGHAMLADPLILDIPEAPGTPEECAELEDTDPNKWHYYEYLNWDKSQDAEFPVSPGDGQKGKHVIVIVHGAHAWTTAYMEAWEKACDALGMTVEFFDPNWDQATQDSYIDQAILKQPDAIVLIPLSADHAAQQFKKINDAGIPAFCNDMLPEASAMNYILSYSGPHDWLEMRMLAEMLGEKMNGEGGVAYITHSVGGSPYYSRTFGPMSTLASLYPNIKHLDVQSPGFEATAVKQVVADWITKYGDELNAIVLADDSDQAVGAVEACKAAGRDDIIVVATGFSRAGSEMLQNGDLEAVTYQSCQNDAGAAIRMVAEYFCGHEIPRVSYIPYDVITAENVEEFLPCQW